MFERPERCLDVPRRTVFIPDSTDFRTGTSAPVPDWFPTSEHTTSTPTPACVLATLLHTVDPYNGRLYCELMKHQAQLEWT